MRTRMSAFLLPPALCLVVILGLPACSDPTQPSDQPTILLMNPRGVVAGFGSFQLAVYGEGFDPGSKVRWNGQERPTSSDGIHLAYAVIAPEDVAAEGTVSITVSRSDGKVSDPQTFTIGQQLEPVMTLATITPVKGTVGSGDLQITATGSGFVRGTVLFADFTPLETTWVSSTTLRAVVPATFFGINRWVGLRPGVPDVWISGTPFPWEVQAGVPQISNLTPPNALVGSDELPVRVLGSGFGSNSVVQVNGVDRPTTYVSGTELGFTLAPIEFGSPATLAVTVTTPPPGGGVSSAVTFAITSTTEAPELAPLPLLGVTAGRPSFTLVVQGQHFNSGTVVQWNGSDRPTTFRSGRRVMAAIPAADVAAPGQVSITVRNPGSPATSPRTLTIYPVPSATVTDVKSVALGARWLAVDPASGRLFATVPSAVPVYGNTVTEIDPATGSILTSVSVGTEPDFAEVSDDGQYLYVGLDGARAVRRVSLPSLTAGPQFSLGGFQADELHVMPGRPQTIAVSRRNPDITPSNSGLVIYDDGVARGLVGRDFTGTNTFGWTQDGSRIFAYNFETTEYGLRRLDVGPDGATQVWVREGLLNGYYVRIQVLGDQIYGDDGNVVDDDLREALGHCSLPDRGRMAIDRALGRGFYWSGVMLRVCDLASYQSLGELTIPGVGAPDNYNIVRWGTDGLAFTDGQKVYLIRTPLAAP